VTILDNPQAIELYRLATLRAALRLEIFGLGRRGQSAYAILKQELGVKGSRESVLAQVNAIIESLEL